MDEGRREAPLVVRRAVSPSFTACDLCPSLLRIEKPSSILASRSARFAIFVVTAAAAAAIVLAAGTLDWLACESEPSAACDRQALAHTQFVVGWAAAGVLLTAGTLQFWRNRVVAAIAFLLAAATVVTWALLADAAVHGWDDLKFFPS
jgi:hypothetical protein